MTLTTLTVAWTGKGRPTVGSVVDLYGTTVLRSLTPAGYLTAASGCYFDYCGERIWQAVTADETVVSAPGRFSAVIERQ